MFETNFYYTPAVRVSNARIHTLCSRGNQAGQTAPVGRVGGKWVSRAPSVTVGRLFSNVSALRPRDIGIRVLGLRSRWLASAQAVTLRAFSPEL